MKGQAMGIDAEMLVKTRRDDITPDAVRRWAFELAASFGHKSLYVRRPDPGRDAGRHCLEVVENYLQDGPAIVAEQGETLIRCHLSTRYYAEHYPRGDLPLILAVARWLRDRIPGAEVWYGGDSSSVLAEPLTDERSAELWAHFVRDGWRAYWDPASIGGPCCDFCLAPMWHSGGGGDPPTRSYSCDGCGLMVSVGADGKVTERGRNE